MLQDKEIFEELVKKASLDNPDLPVNLIKKIIIGMEEAKNGLVSKYKFG